MIGRRHQALFDEYVRELRSAAAGAQIRFETEVEKARRSGISEAEARETVRRHRGPAAADPRVLGVIIQYFFRDQRLNEEVEAAGGDDEVAPLVFVHEMLTGDHQDLWRFLSELPYLPLGLRRDDSRV